MKDINSVGYFPTAETIVDVLCKKTQSNDRLFFRVMVTYYLTKVASMMRTSIQTMDKGVVPINMYAINLAPSGFGKGLSTNIVEETVINQFKDRFLNETFPAISEHNLTKIAMQRANKQQIGTDAAKDKVDREFEALGALAFSFDSGTPAAVKQMRHKLLMANAGSMNLEVDEIGSNLVGQIDILNTFLELYDVGKIKQKLVKNTLENSRNEEIDGRTPTNCMLYGTPAKLLNGGKIEEEMISMFDTGYARRCIFGYVPVVVKVTDKTPEEIFDAMTDTTSDIALQDISDHLGILADSINFNQTLDMSKDVTMISIKYRLQCEKLAASLPLHEEIRKAEIEHRHSKAVKIAGTYAFIDGSTEIKEEHLYNAIKLTEDSGEAFKKLMARDKNYVKLAKYIVEVGREINHVDLVEDLPFYKGSQAQKNELLNLAVAYGSKRGIVIKKFWVNGVEHFKGEALKETDLNEIIVAHSNHVAYRYANELAPFDQLHVLTQRPGHHWLNHHVMDSHRTEDNCIQGFNTIVLDIDGGTSLATAQLLLKDFKYMMYTTKRSTPEANRFRIILPLSHVLKMDSKEYKEFMANVYNWLPFDSDAQTDQRSRKWESFDGTCVYNEGELLDSLLFIPKTAKNEEREKASMDLQSLNNLERWFIRNTGEGNRSNQFIKYALMLVDNGMGIEEIKNSLLALNSKLADKLDDTEILSTVMVSAHKAILARAPK